MTTRTVEEIRAELAEAERRDRNMAERSQAVEEGRYVGKCFIKPGLALRIKHLAYDYGELDVTYAYVYWTGKLCCAEQSCNNSFESLDEFMEGLHEIPVKKYEDLVKLANDMVQGFDRKANEL